MDQIAARFADGGDHRFEVAGLGFAVDFQKDMALAGRGIAEDGRKCRRQFGGRGLLAVELGLEAGVDRDAGPRRGGQLDVLGQQRLSGRE